MWIQDNPKHKYYHYFKTEQYFKKNMNNFP